MCTEVLYNIPCELSSRNVAEIAVGDASHKHRPKILSRYPTPKAKGPATGTEPLYDYLAYPDAVYGEICPETGNNAASISFSKSTIENGLGMKVAAPKAMRRLRSCSTSDT